MTKLYEQITCEWIVQEQSQVCVSLQKSQASSYIQKPPLPSLSGIRHLDSSVKLITITNLFFCLSLENKTPSPSLTVLTFS